MTSELYESNAKKHLSFNNVLKFEWIDLHFINAILFNSIFISLSLIILGKFVKSASNLSRTNLSFSLKSFFNISGKYEFNNVFKILFISPISCSGKFILSIFLMIIAKLSIVFKSVKASFIFAGEYVAKLSSSHFMLDNINNISYL